MPTRPTDLLTLHNVIGVGDGVKEKNGEPTNRRCITAFVRSKVSKERLADSQVVPKKLNDIPTDVVEVGDLKPLSFLDGGNMVSSNNASGTLAGIFRLGGQDVGLTCYHCVCPPGQEQRNVRGSYVYYCGEPIGRVLNHSSFLPRQLSPGNFGVLTDAAIFSLENPGGDPLPGTFGANIPGSRMDKWHDGVIGLPGAPLAGWPHNHRNYSAAYDTASHYRPTFVPAGLGIVQDPKNLLRTDIQLQKFGASTGWTTTDMTWWNTTFSLDYGGVVGTLLFYRQGFSRRRPGNTAMMCAPGDSGAACFDMQGYLTGMLFAGSEIGFLYTPIQVILQEFYTSAVLNRYCLDDETWRMTHGS